MDEYEHHQVLLEELRPRVKTLIEILSKENSIEVHDVQARVKEKNSLKKKIEKKQGKYHDLKDITDIVGIRVITYFNDDVDKMAQVIESEFKVDREHSVDKRVMDPDRFGYSSLHYVVEFNTERLKLIEYKDFRGIKFEIQIRSILQHAWAEIEHDLGYKSKIEVPKEISRDFSRIAGLLEIADNEFIRIKKYLKNYTQKIESKIEKNLLEIPIDKVTLNEYIEKSTTIKNIIKEIGDNIGENEIVVVGEEAVFNLQPLVFFGINTISQLDELLNGKKEEIIKLYLKWNQDQIQNQNQEDMQKLVQLDDPLFYLYYVLLFEDYSLEKLEGYVKTSIISNKFTGEIHTKFQKLLEEKFTL